MSADSLSRLQVARRSVDVTDSVNFCLAWTDKTQWWTFWTSMVAAAFWLLHFYLSPWWSSLKMAQRSSNLVLAGAAAGHGSVAVLGGCHHSRCVYKLISCLCKAVWPCWMLRLMLLWLHPHLPQHQAFVAPMQPLHRHLMTWKMKPSGRRSEFLCLKPYLLSLVHSLTESMG